MGGNDLGLKDDLCGAIKKRMGLVPGSALAGQFGIAPADISKIRRNEWTGISTDKLLVIAERVGVKLVYSLEACEPVRSEKAVKSKYDVENMDTGIF